MNRLYESVVFDRSSLHWFHRNFTDRDFEGYYHWHPCAEVYFVHEGQGSVVVNRQTFDIRRGMLFFFQPYQLHRIHADVSSEHPFIRTVIYVDQDAMAAQLAPFPHRQELFALMLQGSRTLAFDMAKRAPMIEWIFECYNRGRDDKAENENRTILMLQLLELVKLEIERLERSASVARAEEVKPYRYSEIVMRWIETHFHEEIRLEQLAEETHLTAAYLSRVFREETGSSITDYMTARRIKHACRLLQTTSLSIDQIGVRVGYPNVSYFIQLFKKVVGVTPLKYRK